MSKTVGRGKFVISEKTKKPVIRIPVDVAEDSNFPFKDGQLVNVSISGESLVIEKASERPGKGGDKKN